MDFKDRVRSLRNELGMSAADLAAKFGKKEGAVRMWETGKAKADADTLIKLAGLFDVTTDYLLGLTDARQPENALLVGELGFTEESILRIKYYKTNLINADEPLTIQCTFLDVLNKIIPSAEFRAFLSELAILSDPQLMDKFTSIEISDVPSFKISNEKWHTQIINEMVHLIIKKMKGGEQNAPQA